MTERVASYSGPLWHVAYTEPRAELDVAREIDQDLGFDWCLPMERIKGTAHARPLLARYVLFGVDPYREAWQEVLELNGVIDVLMASDDVPGYVPAAWVAAIRKAELVGAFDRTTSLPSMFELNELVRVSDGPFAGLNATIVEFVAKMRSATASKRAKVLVNFMGQLARAELPVTSLEKL